MDPEVKPTEPKPEGNQAPPPEQNKAKEPAQKDEVVSINDFKKLQSTYDTKFNEITEANKSLQDRLAEAEAELKLAKEGMPKDQAEMLKREKELQNRESKLKTEGESLSQRARALKARELISSYKPEGMTEADLVKLGSETDMELAVLRKVTEPKKQTLPPANQVDQGGRSAGGPLSEREGLLAEIDAAKRK